MVCLSNQCCVEVQVQNLAFQVEQKGMEMLDFSMLEVQKG